MLFPQYSRQLLLSHDPSRRPALRKIIAALLFVNLLVFVMLAVLVSLRQQSPEPAPRALMLRIVPYAPVNGTVTPNSDTTDVVELPMLTAPLTFHRPLGNPMDGASLLVHLQSALLVPLVWDADGYDGEETHLPLPMQTSGRGLDAIKLLYSASEGRWRHVATTLSPRDAP